MRKIILLAALSLTACEKAEPEIDKASGLPKASERQRIQILEMRADANGPMAINFDGGKADSAIFTSGGVPMEFGVRKLSPERQGYRLTMWVGNLSSVVIGDCQATFSIRAGDKADVKEAIIPGMFSPGESTEFNFVIPSNLDGATGLTMSAPKCRSAFYPD